MNCDALKAQQDLLSFMAAWGSTVEVSLASTSSIPCPRLSKYLIKLDAIEFDGLAFGLTDPISVTLYQEDGQWNCEHEAFGILSVGNTAEEAVHSFSEDFSVLWDEIAQCPDDVLTAEAQAVKKSLLAVVKSVKTR